MNTSIFIVKIISQPIQSFFIGDISIVELMGEFPKVKKKKLSRYQIINMGRFRRRYM